MLITTKDEVKKPFKSPSGEKIFEMIGRSEDLGKATKHSLAYVVIPHNCSTRLHFHPKAEESYYILKGTGKLIINDWEYLVHPGDAIFISTFDKHQIFADGNTSLEFLAICAPAWEPTNTTYPDE